MAPPPGNRLGTYEIVALLGSGGMGEVYRARDTKLNREVAIKVLPPDVAQDPERLGRFKREAQLLAALNHPNIAAIYGLDEANETLFLVLEIVEGEDLAERLKRGAIPLDEALDIAKQIASAIEAAHEKGIVHRDLKPANVKLTPDGKVKVLDFGLARAYASDASGAGSFDSGNSPTMTHAATMAGMILGTAAYMSPEQARGKSVDKRADIWAFGVVLYEMLTGERAFKGEDNSETLASVLKETPAFAALPAATPGRLRETLSRCLQKDPRLRLRDIGDVKLELDAIAACGGEDAPAAKPRSRPSLGIVAAVVVIVAAVGVAIGWGLPRGSAADPAATIRFIVGNPGEGDSFGPILTPDGRFLIFAADVLYKRDLASFAATPIPGTEGATSPMISPDGRWVAFFVHGKIKKVSLAGGDPMTIGEAGGSMPGAVWGPGDTILFSRGWATGLFSLPTEGGQVRQVTEPDRKLGERGHWRPRVLPGGKRALFTIWMAGAGVNDARVGLLDLKTGQHQALFPGASAHYLRSGHVLYFHAGAWHIVPFDAAAGKVTGDPTTVLDDALGVAPDGGSSSQSIWVSDNGTLAYQPGPSFPKRELVWVDRSGTMEPLGLPPHATVDAALSPDGRRVAIGRLEGGTFELWMDDIERKTEDRLDISGSNFGALWFPKGDGIAFVSERKGEYDVYTARSDGSNVQSLLTNDFDESPVAWTGDGRRLLEKEWHPDGSVPLVLIDTGAGNARQVLNPNLGGGASVKLASDDRWLLFSSSSSGRSEVYVQPFPAGTPVVRVSSSGGGDPLWSPDGTEIFFRHQKDLVSVSFHEEGGRGVIGTEKPLFRLGSSTIYGITPDGRRFLVGRLAEPEPPPGIRVVLNWFEELKARGPVK